MKKNLLICFFSIGFFMLTHAQQLQFSTWTRFDTFFNDTVFQHFDLTTCTNSSPDGLLVSSIYTEDGNVFTIYDVSGPYACSSSAIGTYTFTISNGTSLQFTLVSDACAGRANSLTEGPYTRMPPKTIHIPADYLHIQEGIEAADNMDTVLVAEGTYYENINFLGKKPLMVASEFLMDADTNHINNTIINGSQPTNPEIGSVVRFILGEDTTSVLCGFTITGGSGTIESSVNGRMGGGIHITYSGAKLLNNYIQDNIISHEGLVYGGGVQAGGPITDIPWVIMRNNRISNNKAISSADEGAGGGIAEFYNLILINNEISYNEANGPLRCDGGGVHIMGAFGTIQLEIKNNIIAQNKAVSLGSSSEYAISGGLCIAYDGAGIVSDNVISYNEIETTGNTWAEATGVLVQEVIAEDFVFENNIITSNTYVGSLCMGGGLFLYNTGGKFQNNVIRDNPATQGGGISVVNNSGKKPILINNTITGNTATTKGGGLYLENAEANVVNSIIWDNTAPTGASIYTEGSNLEVRYSDVGGDDVWPGEGNVNCNATFLEDGYHLSDTCQLVESGIASIIINGTLYECPAYDIDGDARPLNARPEIGADEVLLVSIREPMEANSLSINIYPNPASEKIAFELSNAATRNDCYFSICNITGQELILQNVTGSKMEINISSLPAGVYFIKLKSNDRNTPIGVGKFVKN